MDKTEYTKRYEIIKNAMDSTLTDSNNIISISNALPDQISNLIKSIQFKNKNYLQYTKNLSDMNYNDTLTTSSDLFPGIRTASQSADPEELAKKATEMSSQASNIKLTNQSIEISKETTLKNIKNLLKLLTEFVIVDNQIEDWINDLLKDLDNIYDIGALTRNT